jgi:DNA-binding transcriptional ArsR family regulator
MRFITDGTAETFMHPARFKIMQILRRANQPIYVDQIAKEAKVNARMTSHHLDVLEEQGLVRSEYKLMDASGSRRKVAVRLCSATEKTEEVIKNIQEAIR